jgi:hypothetical protein
MADIVLATLNARYSHASLGLRCLHANLGELRSRARIEELVVGAPLQRMLERLLAGAPKVIGFGVYIWNVAQTTSVIAALRDAAPGVRIVVGGPEVSHELDDQPIVRLADHVITGWGEVSFARLCRQLLHGPRPLSKVIAGEQPELDRLASPYPLYSDADIAHRHLYVEASRGCPFKCEFCLSALDRTAWPFDTARFLEQIDALHRRGARRFKFVDRTFNLKPATSLAILGYFLGRIAQTPRDPVFAHFELVPDHLPDSLKQAVAQFPVGTLQFEIGIQTWNPQVQATIGRRQDNGRAEANLEWLRRRSNAHLHVDLIAGLPGEDAASFAAGFDRLFALAPHEIQVGLLKRLRGAPIARHTAPFGIVYQPEPPYRVLQTNCLSPAEVDAIARFARHWDRVANSGRFPRTVALALAGGSAYARFDSLSRALQRRLGTDHRIALERLAGSLRDALVEIGADPAEATEAAVADYAATGASGRPSFLARGVPGAAGRRHRQDAAPERQARFFAMQAAAPDAPDAPDAPPRPGVSPPRISDAAPTAP